MIAQGHSAGFLAQLATTAAASTAAPALLYTFYGGTTLTIGLYLFSSAVPGSSTALVPTADFAWFGQSNPAVISVPAAFLLGWVGSLVGRRRDGRALALEEDPRAVDALLVTGRPLASRAVTAKDPSARIR